VAWLRATPHIYGRRIIPSIDFLNRNQDPDLRRNLDQWTISQRARVRAANSAACEQYHNWARHLDVVLRQDHRAGEKTFVGHAGDTIQVGDPATGQSRPAYVFVAVLGASNYTYAEATWTRSLPDWTGSHTTRIVVPRNGAFITGWQSWRRGQGPLLDVRSRKTCRLRRPKYCPPAFWARRPVVVGRKN
jgi:hypothetical protein